MFVIYSKLHSVLSNFILTVTQLLKSNSLDVNSSHYLAFIPNQRQYTNRTIPASCCIVQLFLSYLLVNYHTNVLQQYPCSLKWHFLSKNATSIVMLSIIHFSLLYISLKLVFLVDSQTNQTGDSYISYKYIHFSLSVILQPHVLIPVVFILFQEQLIILYLCYIL